MRSGNKEKKIKRRHEKQKNKRAGIRHPCRKTGQTPISRGCHFETRTVCNKHCGTPKQASTHCVTHHFCLASHEAGHVPPQVGLARHRTFLWAACTTSSKRTLQKREALSSRSPVNPKTSPPQTTKPIDSAPARTRILFPLQLHIPLCGNWPIPTCRPHDPNHAMPQLTSSFASAAAGQNRDSRGSGRSDSARGAGSGEW